MHLDMLIINDPFRRLHIIIVIVQTIFIVRLHKDKIILLMEIEEFIHIFFTICVES